MVPLQQLLDPLPQGKVISAYSLKKGRSLSRNLLFQGLDKDGLFLHWRLRFAQRRTDRR